jgi:hypothetical protein
MKPGFCGKCCYLSITEEEQNKLKPKPDHICNKFNIKLYHFNYHPNILRCNRCLLVPGLVYSNVVKNSFGEPGVVYSFEDDDRKLTGSQYSMYIPKDIRRGRNGEEWLFGGRPRYV